MPDDFQQIEEMTPAALLRKQALFHPEETFLIDANTDELYTYARVWEMVRHERAYLAHEIERTESGVWYLEDVSGISGIIQLIALSEEDKPVCLLNARMSDTERDLRMNELVKAAGKSELLQRPGIIMFTSGTTGTPKGVHLSWRALIAQARAFHNMTDAYRWVSGARDTDDASSAVVWQSCLPLYHVGGLQVIIRTLVSGGACIVHERADISEILRAAACYGATHISVVDKLLMDLMNFAEGENPRLTTLTQYHCILLGGQAPNQMHLMRARAAGLRVWVSFGATELGSNCAIAPVDGTYTGGLKLLPGYEARLVSASSKGVQTALSGVESPEFPLSGRVSEECCSDFEAPSIVGTKTTQESVDTQNLPVTGQLLVRGPSVCSGYINAAAPFVDGWYQTGDVAYFLDGAIFIHERVSDMFVSGGENIYPEEIRQRLCSLLGVSDAFVTSRVSETWGRRPVALVATPYVHDVSRTRYLLADIHDAFSRLMCPDAVMLCEEIPLRGIGKPDRRAIELYFSSAVSIRAAHVYRISVPLRTPMRTAKETLDERVFVLVALIDDAGQSWWGEVDSFESDWYLPETLDKDVEFLMTCALPTLVGRAFSGGLREFDSCLSSIDPEAAYPMATFALSSAFDQMVDSRMPEGMGAHTLDGSKISSSKPVLLSGTLSALGKDATALEEGIQSLIRKGICRIKIKIDATVDAALVVSILRKFPEAYFVLDANQSLTASNIRAWADALTSICRVDDSHSTPEEFSSAGIAPVLSPARRATNILYIEEPCSSIAQNLQAQISLPLPVALDESWTNIHDIPDLLAEIEALRERMSSDEHKHTSTSAPTSYAISASNTSTSLVSADAPTSMLSTTPVIVIKPGKLSTYTQMRDVIARAQSKQIPMVLGGMFEAGLGKYLCAREEACGDFTYPGDISHPADIFEEDVWDTPFEIEVGRVEGCHFVQAERRAEAASSRKDAPAALSETSDNAKVLSSAFMQAAHAKIPSSAPRIDRTLLESRTSQKISLKW